MEIAWAVKYYLDAERLYIEKWFDCNTDDFPETIEPTDARYQIVLAVLMHMGSMAVIGSRCPENLVHIVINNEAHETVGGMPTAVSGMDLCIVAEGCGYPHVTSVETYEKLDEQLFISKKRKALSFIEVKCAIGSRADLGRPTTTTQENKEEFMKYLENYC